MSNPFENLDKRLNNIENILLDIKRNSKTQFQPETEPTDELLNVEQTATFLKLSVPTIYGKVHRRELPVMKQGNRLYFSKFELLEYLKQGRQQTVQEIEDCASDYLLNKKRLNDGK